METCNIKKSIETLEAHNENGQFDQVIDSLRDQFQAALAEEQTTVEAQKYGLTKEQYDKVIYAFENDKDPFNGYYKFTNAQMNLLAHKWATKKNEELFFDLDYNIVTFDEAYNDIRNNIDYYFDIEKEVYDNFERVDEDTLYRLLIDVRNRECQIDEKGDLVLEEAV